MIPRPFRPLIAACALAVLAAACTGAASTTSTRPVETTTASTAPDTEPTPTTIEPPATSSTMSTPPATPTTTRAFDPSDLNLGAGSNFISLDDPVMIPATSATWLQPDDVVLGLVASDGTAHAFPIRQMSYHHIANTTIAGEPYVVTY